MIFRGGQEGRDTASWWELDEDKAFKLKQYPSAVAAGGTAAFLLTIPESSTESRLEIKEDHNTALTPKTNRHRVVVYVRLDG